MTLKEIESSPAYRTMIGNLLSNEGMKLLLGALESHILMELQSDPLQIAGIHYDTTVAHKHHNLKGKQWVIQKIRALGGAGPQPYEPPTEEEQFAHGLEHLKPQS